MIPPAVLYYSGVFQLLCVSVFTDVCECFHMKLKVVFSSSVKNCIRILIRIASNLQITFGQMIIFTILILLINEHGRPFHFLIFL